MKQMPFLINPQGKRDNERVNSPRKRRKRRPVKSATKRRSSATTGVATMARKRHRRHTRRRNPPVHHAVARRRRRHHFRRNPMGLNIGGIGKTLTSGVMDAAWGIGGKVAGRATAKQFGTPGTMTFMLMEAGVGVLGAMLLKKMSPAGTRAFLQGSFMGAIETYVITNQIPVLMNYLGDYNTGALHVPGSYNAIAVDPMRQVGAMSGYPASRAMSGYPMAGYPEDSMGDFDTMAGRYGR